MGLRVRLPDSSTMNSEQVGHLPLALPPAAIDGSDLFTITTK